MKLASYNDGSRDGHLVVVSRDLGWAHYASGVATRMQQVLEDWDFLAPQLEELSISLNHGRARHAFPFEPAKCLAPLPRAHQWCVAPAWPQEAVQEVTQEAAVSAATPLVWRGAGDALLGPCASPALVRAEARPAEEALGLDVEAQWVVVTADVPAGSRPAEAQERVRLVGLAAAWWQREVLAQERARGQAPLHAWPATSFSPVLVTPDELGEAWRAGKMRLPLRLSRNGDSLGHCHGGRDMLWSPGQLLAWLARHQRLSAGTLLGLGPVRPAEAAWPVPPRPGSRAKPEAAFTEGRLGACSLADLRALAARQTPPQLPPPWLAAGDQVTLDVLGADGHSVFGAIQAVLTEQGDEVPEVQA